MIRSFEKYIGGGGEMWDEDFVACFKLSEQFSGGPKENYARRLAPPWLGSESDVSIKVDFLRSDWSPRPSEFETGVLTAAFTHLNVGTELS
jgi:hypothetical protein